MGLFGGFQVSSDIKHRNAQNCNLRRIHLYTYIFISITYLFEDHPWKKEQTVCLFLRTGCTGGRAFAFASGSQTVTTGLSKFVRSKGQI